jgi:sugar O-acyltransferase (sialic acid O-acetyltransferase NeuD family)
MEFESLVIAGAGGFCREVVCWVGDAARVESLPPIRGYLVDPQFERLATHYGLSWLGGLDDYEPLPNEACVLAVSDPNLKRQMVQRLLARGARFATVVHPTAVVAKTATVGTGSIICPFALVSADVVLGEFVTVNAMSSIGHDSKLGAFTSLSAHVDVTGGVTVGEAVFFGSGARVLPKLTVGNSSKIGAGAVVMRSMAAGVTVYTNPARKLS